MTFQSLKSFTMGSFKEFVNQGIKFSAWAEFLEKFNSPDEEVIPGLTLLLASWLSWQDLAEFLLHFGNHGTHGKILIKILLR